VVQWCSGIFLNVQWCSGAVVHSLEMCNGAMVQWLFFFLQVQWCSDCFETMTQLLFFVTTLSVTQFASDLGVGVHEKTITLPLFVVTTLSVISLRVIWGSGARENHNPTALFRDNPICDQFASDLRVGCARKRHCTTAPLHIKENATAPLHHCTIRKMPLHHCTTAH
jgi:hypothetical protein